MGGSLKILALTGDRAALAVTLCAMVVAAIAEIVGVAIVASFVSYIGNPAAPTPIARLGFDIASFDNPVALLGVFCFFALLCSNIFQAATTNLLLKFTWSTGAVLACRAFEASLERSYQQHIESHSSEFVVKILHDVHSAISNVLIPTLTTIARALSSIAILALLIWVDYRIALIAMIVAAGSYALIFAILASGIAELGKRSHAGRLAMYKIASDVFAAIAEVKVFRAERIFLNRFRELSRSSAKSEARSQMMRQLPRYLVETFAFGGIVLIVVVASAVTRQDDAFLPLLAVYAVAAWRLLPAAQQIFSNVTSVRHHWPSVDAVSRLLSEAAPARSDDNSSRTRGPSTALAPFDDEAPALDLQRVDFGYVPGNPIFSGLNLRVERGDIVGVAGRSGAGKTTFLGLCLGLLAPQHGSVRFFGLPHSTSRSDLIGYVPQSPRFFNDTLRFNVTLDADLRNDDEKIWRVLRSAELDDVVARLADGLDTKLGEQGIGLSGGQLQRLALARALYVDPKLLILDEFTSSLDAGTERSILDTLQTVLEGRTALIVTHRPEVLQICTRVVRI